MDLKRIPENAGVYIFKDHKNKVLYVGKAINLKNRVSSYFANFNALTPKTKALVSHIAKIDFIKVNNEIESLLLEADLIKRYKPPYNINLKDDKFYKYIKIEKKIEGLYSISTARKLDKDKATYMGPFPESTSINIILKTLRKIFPYKDCSDTKFIRYKKLNRPCLYGYIGVCPAPCVHMDSKQTNNDNVKKIIKYLKGDRTKLFDKIKLEMTQAAKDHNFEKAAYLRDQVRAYEYLTQEKKDIQEYTLNPNLFDDSKIEGLKTLLTELNKIDIKFDKANYEEFRIEVFDISNFQGKNAVGSMVVLTGGHSDKKEYRRFKIITKDTPNDFAMMNEMLTRRFKRNSKGDYLKTWNTPDLIVIDGGKGQLSTALAVLAKYDIKIPIIGLAKRNEEIIYHKNGKFLSLELPKNNAGLNIIIKGRDEAHRFGITFYRKLHQKKLLST